MIYLLLCIYAHVHGQTNAFLYSVKGAEALPENEHRWLVIERVLFAVCALAGLAYGVALAVSTWAAFNTVLGEVIAGGLAFSFWHNRAYYLMRDRIDGTNYGARHQSASSTAKFDFSYTRRRWYMLASVPLLLINYTALWAITRFL